MSLTFAVWLVILGAVLLANLPFVLDRPLAPWPWARPFRPFGGLTRWAAGLGFLALLALWSWGTVRLAGGAFGGVGNALFVVKLLISIALAALLLSTAGWMAGRPADSAATAAQDARPDEAASSPAAMPARGVRVSAQSAKPFIDRLLEVLVGYVLIGTLGFTLELDLGNAFPQGWEFYAVTLALFLVLGYPGFVWRYMLQRRRR